MVYFTHWSAILEYKWEIMASWSTQCHWGMECVIFHSFSIFPQKKVSELCQNRWRGLVWQLVSLWILTKAQHQWCWFLPQYPPQVLRFPDTYSWPGVSTVSSLHLSRISAPIKSGSRDTVEKIPESDDKYQYSNQTNFKKVHFE